MADLRPGGREGQVGHHVADEIAGQRQLGKDDQVGVLPAGGLDLLQVQGQVARQVAQRGRDLRHRHPQNPPLVGGSRVFVFHMGNATRGWSCIAA